MKSKGSLEDPNPYIQIWMGCKKWSTESHKLLPSSGGWLDQDLETMIALDMLDELHQKMQERDAEWNAVHNSPDAPHTQA